MALISTERLREETIRHNTEMYGVSGWRWVRDVADVAAERGAKTILDYGAGKGTFRIAMERFSPEYEVREFDPVTLPGEPESADVVVCTDVLEFVEDLDAVLEHIRLLAEKAVFIAVPMHPENKARPGLRIESLSWWRECLSAVWLNNTADVVTFFADGVRKVSHAETTATKRLRFIARW